MAKDDRNNNNANNAQSAGASNVTQAAAAQAAQPAKEPEIKKEPTASEMVKGMPTIPAPDKGLADMVDVMRKRDPKLVEMVTVVISHGFKMRLDNHAEVSFSMGTQRIYRFLAEHWYAMKNGVKIFDPVADAAKKAAEAKAAYEAAVAAQESAQNAADEAQAAVAEANASAGK